MGKLDNEYHGYHSAGEEKSWLWGMVVVILWNVPRRRQWQGLDESAFIQNREKGTPGTPGTPSSNGHHKAIMTRLVLLFSSKRNKSVGRGGGKPGFSPHGSCSASWPSKRALSPTTQIPPCLCGEISTCLSWRYPTEYSSDVLSIKRGRLSLQHGQGGGRERLFK